MQWRKRCSLQLKGFDPLGRQAIGIKVYTLGRLETGKSIGEFFSKGN